MTASIKLPSDFADLAPLASHWARDTESERSRIRWSATPAQFAEFHDAMMPRLDAILAAMQACALEQLDEPHRGLFNLVAAFAEAAPHHELYAGSPRVPHSFAAERFVPGHGQVPSWSARIG